MTIRDYIVHRMQGFKLNDADIAEFELSSGMNIEEDYTPDVQSKVNLALIDTIEWHLFAPRVENVTESGFSVSWNYADLGKFYVWLCKKYGKKPNDEVLSLLGVSVIRDISNLW